jgi:uncharacterized protein (UPF0332 family)
MDALASAYMHLRTARKLRVDGEYNAALSKLYYAAFHAAQAALADLGSRSKKHASWLGEFSRRHGRGLSWVPKSYPKLLHRLSGLREDHDYRNMGPSDKALTMRLEQQVARMLKLVHRNTPLLRYPELIESQIIPRHAPEALEFDYYCPRSYFHKERLQLQIQAAGFAARKCNLVRTTARDAMRALNATRQSDYVLGWNSRLGQPANRYLLFLDLDTPDLAALKKALSKRRGWLFASGGGFHFVSAELLPSDRMWRLRLGQASRSRDLKKHVDAKHVEFSLRRGYSTLRVTSSPAKAFEPFLCWDNT